MNDKTKKVSVEPKSAQLTASDKTEIKSVANAMAGTYTVLKDAYLVILALLGFDEKKLLADGANHFQPEKFRFNNVMAEWEAQLFDALVKVFISGGMTKDNAKNKATNKVKNDKATMMAWFRDESNTGFSFFRPTEKIGGDDVDEKKLTPKEAKEKALKEETQALNESVKVLIQQFREIKNQVIKNNQARANGNSELIVKDADSTFTKIANLIRKYHSE